MTRSGASPGKGSAPLVRHAWTSASDEVNRLAAERTQSQAEDEGRLEAVRRRIASMIRAIEDGLYQPSMKARMAELEAEKAALEQRLAAAPAPSPVRLHPNLAGLYREKVAALQEALFDPSIKAEAMEIVRGQIERITLTPGDDGGLDVALQGDLARILQLCEGGSSKSKRPRTNVLGRELSVVAGAHNHLYRTFMDWTQPYRLGFLGAEQTCRT